MKKVLFTSHTANFAKFNQPFIQDLRKKGYEVHYASADDEEVPNVDKYIHVDFARSPHRFDKHWRAYWQMRSLLKRENYDLIHTHTPVGSVMTRVALNYPYRLQKKTPVIYTAHGFHFYKGASLLNWLLFYPVEKLLARDTDALLVINDEDEDLAKRKLKAKRIERLNGVGVDLTKFHVVSKKEKIALRKKMGFGTKDFILIYVAELNKNKDQELIIKNAEQIRAEIPNLKILLVGEGAQKEKLKNLARKLGVDDVVEFLGYRKDTDKLYQMSDVVISASQREGLGLSVIEGMASGLPAVVRNNRGHREIITSEQIGWLFHSAEEFVEKIIWLYESPEKRIEMGMNATKSVERFSLDLARKKMDKIYQDFLEK